MKYFKLFENYALNEGLIMSMDGMKLYIILQRYITPNHNVSRPSGRYLDEIDIYFKSPNRYNDKIRSIMNVAGWYPANIGGRAFTEERLAEYKKKDSYTISFKPKFGFEIAKIIPAKLYHLSPSKYDLKIENHGLKPVSKIKKDAYPERIYLAEKTWFFEKLAKELSIYNDENLYSVWEIDTSLFKINKLYIDSTVSWGGCYYLQGVNIPPHAIKKIDSFDIYKS